MTGKVTVWPDGKLLVTFPEGLPHSIREDLRSDLEAALPAWSRGERALVLDEMDVIVVGEAMVATGLQDEDGRALYRRAEQ